MMRRIAWAAIALVCGAMPAAQASADVAAVEGGQIYYETCGSGARTLVLLHDGILHSAAFDAIWPALCRQYRVVRYDRRGFGQSAAAAAPYAPLDDLQAVMRAASVTKAVLVGGSDGGGLALSFAAQSPEAVEGLVLIGPSVSGFPPSKAFISRSQAVVAALRSGGPAKAVNDDPYFIAPQNAQAKARVVAMLTANPQNLTHAEPARRPPPVRPRLAAIKTPVLVLTGDSDIADSQAAAGSIEALAPNARRVVVPGAGHLVYVEQPEAVLAEIDVFLNPGPPKPSRTGASQPNIE